MVVQNHSIEAIFFDFGGVLLETFDGIDHDGIEARLGLEAKTLRRCLYAESRYNDYQIGACTYEDWIESILAAVERHTGDKAEAVMRAWQESPRAFNQEMLDLVKRLHGRYTLGIISNTIPGMEERLRERFEHVDLFEVRIGSGDLGIAKPDAGIFLHAAQQAGVQPERCVFTDDRAGFAESARAVGMHGFHFTGYEQFVEDLRSVGVAV